MSKQPHVWVVEVKSSGGWLQLPRYAFYVKSRGERYIAEGRGGEFSAYATYRVAKYVRVEPTAKPRKIRTTMIKLGPGKFVEKDCDAVMTWTQPKKGRKT